MILYVDGERLDVHDSCGRLLDVNMLYCRIYALCAYGR